MSSAIAAAVCGGVEVWRCAVRSIDNADAAWTRLAVRIKYRIEVKSSSLDSSVFSACITMSSVVSPLDQPSNYKDSQSRVDRQKQHDYLSKSSTLYVRASSLFGRSGSPNLYVSLRSAI